MLSIICIHQRLLHLADELSVSTGLAGDRVEYSQRWHGCQGVI